jgi:hypothetical protein
MLAWLYASAPAVGFETRLLHAHVQTFGFFATLIVGVAPSRGRQRLCRHRG